MTEFDYIIVGAGSAGCVLANRLSVDPHTHVLLLEAGGTHQNKAINIPAAFPTNFRTPRDWAFETEPQQHLDGRRMFHPRGKVLGGCSSINAMIYMRGHPLDYDGWAQQHGCVGWSFSDVLPYFKRSEFELRFSEEYHGRSGPLTVGPPRYRNPLSKAFVEAGQRAGIPPREDFNGESQEGIGFYALTLRTGKRESSATAFLDPVRNRSNLRIETDAQVLKLEIQDHRVTGVTLRQAGAVRTLHARREVLLCAGAIQSPHLLMLSGIGPATQLREQGIPVVHDSPEVGRNLQDHLLAPVTYRCREPIGLAGLGVGSLLKFLLFRQGPLTSNLAEAGLFGRTRPELPAPDLQMLFGPIFYLHHGFTQVPGHGFSLVPVMLLPESRGTVSLRSADPLQSPKIDPNYLATEHDRQTLFAGIQLARRIAAQPPLANFADSEFTPGKEQTTDEALFEFLKQYSDTCYHPVGTCRMGSDASAVVDPALRVKGVTGLRVVDASVMPRIIRGNTNAPTIMIAEKAADLIRS